jgi:4-hydroxybenzoyl-CoA thioesterase
MRRSAISRTLCQGYKHSNSKDLSMTQKEFSIPIRVYIEDTDAGGIVYYVNYLKFMERSRTELFRSLGFPKPAVLEEGMLMVVASAEANYRMSARLDDQLRVTTRIKKLARSFVEFEQNVFRQNESGEELLCEGSVKVACVKRDTMRPCPFPQRVKQALNEYLGGEG